MKVIDIASRNIGGLIVETLEGFRENLDTFSGSHLGTACEHVDSCVLVLRPGVNGEVRLSDHDHSTYSKRIEFVELRADYGGIADFSAVKKSLLNFLRIIQILEIAIKEFCDVMLSQKELVAHDNW